MESVAAAALAFSQIRQDLGLDAKFPEDPAGLQALIDQAQQSHPIQTETLTAYLTPASFAQLKQHVLGQKHGMQYATVGGTACLSQAPRLATPTISSGAQKAAGERTHVKARTEKPDDYPNRALVPDDRVSWSAPWPEYNPVAFSFDQWWAGKKGDAPFPGWAISMADEYKLENVDSYGTIRFDTEGRPLNPQGRTGITGRGKLGKAGANFAADPIIIRHNPESGQLEMLAILRDNEEWAIPGGMVDKGEAISATLSRELYEETHVKVDMSDAITIYQGYVDDPRNTDNAWMETTARLKLLPDEIGAAMEPTAGDDAKAVQWMPLTDANIQQLYASHADFVRGALAKIKEIA